MSSESATREPSEVHIVPMTSGHLGTVLELWRKTEGLMLADVDNPTDLENYLHHNPGMSHVALARQQVIGAVLCGHDGRRGFLYHLSVAPEHRRQGIGRALVDASLFALREQGIDRCNLFVITDNSEGIRFWRNSGWYDWPTIRLMSRDHGEPGRSE